LMDADPRLTVPLLMFFAGYVALLWWAVRRVGPASQASSDARSELTGCVVDSYTNIHSVKMFAHHDRELSYVKRAIDHFLSKLWVEQRIYSLMDIGMTVLNGFLIVGVVGWAIALWLQGTASVGVVAVATALTLRLSSMTGWIMFEISSLFRELGVVSEGMRTIAQPVTLVDKPGAASLKITRGEICVEHLTHHYGRGAGGLQDLT
ncbi:MAG: ABC transporter ATP-binding protein, partial [Pseudomonadota bacterium]